MCPGIPVPDAAPSNDTQAEIVCVQLSDLGLTLAVAESCTGGLIGHRITTISGSSQVFLGGVTAYANEVKSGMLGVPQALLEAHGAVSAETAEAMAVGVRRALSADLAVSVTGIAGPTGGTDEKPVGLVYIGLAGRSQCIVERFVFEGDRARIKWSASCAALELVLAHAHGVSR